MNEKPEIEVGKLPVITKFIYTLGVLPTSYLMSMTYQEQVTWLYNYLQTQVIPAINTDVEAVQELQNLYELLRTYVNDYFDNLDVQEEINTKLEKMAIDGSLTNLIKNYIDPIQETFENEINTEITNMNNNIEYMKTKIDNSLGITPIVVSNISDMTDTTKIYVLSSSGQWYYYNGTEWIVGGIYQSSVNTTDANNQDLILNIMNDNPQNIAGYVGSGGTIIDSQNFSHTDYIEVFSKEVLIVGKVNIFSLTGAYNIACFSKNKRYLGGATITELTTNYLYLANLLDNTYYIILSDANANASGHKMYMNNGKLNFSQFGFLQPFENTINHQYLIDNNITSIKQLDTNKIYQITSDVLNTDITDLPEYGHVGTLLKYNGQIPNGWCCYLYLDNQNNFYYCYGTGTDTNNNWSKLINNDFESINFSAFSGFKKFGVIGDSLSVGHINDSNSQVYGRNIWYSWPQYLARKLSTIALNFGFSGASCQSWFTSTTHGYIEFNNTDNQCQAYIVGLGVNDNYTIGSISDIDWNNPENNNDTFYGNYAKILQTINSKYPEAKIFTLTIGYPRIATNKNKAIRSISNNEHLHNVYLVDIADTFDYIFRNSSISNFYNENHFTASGYANVANAMNYCLNEVMKNNSNDFIDIFKIPYGNNDIIN